MTDSLICSVKPVFLNLKGKTELLLKADAIKAKIVSSEEDSNSKYFPRAYPKMALFPFPNHKYKQTSKVNYKAAKKD